MHYQQKNDIIPHSLVWKTIFPKRYISIQALNDLQKELLAV